MKPQISLDELLYGSPTWEDVALFFTQGEFHEEHYLIQAINKYLLTPEQKQVLFNLNISIEDCLNGRVTPDKMGFVNLMYENWNKKLGAKVFGYQ